MVDLLDFPGSVWTGILELLGNNKKIILVGNKFDMMVLDKRQLLLEDYKYYER